MNRTPDWDRLREIGKENRPKMPATLSEWQRMFNRIYPRSEETTHERNFSRLAEELGELAEGIRLLPISRKYFLSEAADVFAWLMGAANQFEYDQFHENMRFELAQTELSGEYPGKCRHCDSGLCKCPPILQSTFGRISHEVPPSAFPEEEGGVLFTIEEADAHFRLAYSKIRVGGNELAVTVEMLEELKTASSGLLRSVNALRESQGAVDAKLDTAIVRLQEMASRQQLTQDEVDKVAAAFKELPAESERVVIDFLNHMASSVWLKALLGALGVH